MNTEKELTQRILRLMLERNVTAKELTGSTGISRTAVSEWKSGRTTPSVEHVRRVADFFSVSTDYLINGSDYNLVNITDAQLNELLDTSMTEVFLNLNLQSKLAVHDFFIQCLHNITDKAEKNISSVSDQPDFDPLADFEARQRNGEFD